jgi:hypothetical protein
MKPNAGQIVATSAGQLMMQVAPQLTDSYAQANAGLIGMILSFCANEFENGADMRMRENNEMRDLLASLEPHIDESKLRTRLGGVMAGRDASLKISELDKTNAELRKLFIDVHAHLEELPTLDAKTQIRRIWAMLSAHAERRVLKLPGF